MSKYDKSLVFVELKKLAVALGDEVTQERLTGYVEYLSRYEIKDVKKALFWSLENCKFFPAISELKQFLEPKISNDDKINYMTGKIMKAIRTYGGYQGASAKEFLGDRLWEAVEFSGGWKTLCDTNVSQLSNLRAQLRRAVSGSQHSEKIENMLTNNITAGLLE